MPVRAQQTQHDPLPRVSLAAVAASVCAGAVLIVLLSQLPVTHTVNIGGYDAAYVQGFHDPQYTASPAPPPPYLAGSAGRARWSRAQSYLLFPQAGTPAAVTLRLRGWRPDGAGPPPRVRLLLNGHTLLADIQTSGEWEEHRVFITSGIEAWRKASDVVIELRTTPATLDDGRQVGVLLDQATYRVFAGPGGIITPYPTQVLYGALVALLLWLLIRLHFSQRRAALLAGGALLLVGATFLLLCRMQPPLYPYPLRWLLPAVLVALAAVLVLRHAPALLLRRPALLDALALAGIAGWTGRVLLVAQEHVTLSVPGVENDFRVFATRTSGLDAVLRADGFYNLGYPLLLWLVQPLTQGNAFLAGRVLAALSGALLLLASYWLARTLLAEQPGYRRVGALLTVLVLASSPFVVQYALYVGSDMPFAALVALTLALLVAGTVGRHTRLWLVALAGAAAGAAFLVRHPGLVLLPWGALHCLLLHWRRGERGARELTLSSGALLFAAGFLLAASPQLAVNTLQTGQPFYNQQAKNIWLAVYAGIDWTRWHEVPDSIGLGELVLRDPPRFLGNWWHNLLGFLGSGAEDTSEFGRAVQLRLLGWPANWLAVGGLLAWLLLAGRHWRSRLRAPKAGKVSPLLLPRLSLLLLLTGYVLLVCLAFLLRRFFLPLTPVYALAAAWSIGALTTRAGAYLSGAAVVRRRYRWQVGVALLLLVLLWDGFGSGARYVLERQPPDEEAITRLALTTLHPGERVAENLPADVPLAKYSALAHRVLPWPAAQDEQAALAQARAAGAALLLWDETSGLPPLPNPDAALVGRSGRFGLYRLNSP